MRGVTRRKAFTRPQTRFWKRLRPLTGIHQRGNGGAGTVSAGAGVFISRRDGAFTGGGALLRNCRKRLLMEETGIHQSNDLLKDQSAWPQWRAAAARNDRYAGGDLFEN